MGVIDFSKNVDPQFDELLKFQADQRDKFRKGLFDLDHARWFDGLTHAEQEDLIKYGKHRIRLSGDRQDKLLRSEIPDSPMPGALK